MRLAWGDVPGVGMVESIQDVKRAEKYAANFASLVNEQAGERTALRALDNRLATIAITENSQAFNAERRAIANAIADRFALIEIWDATLDYRTCPVCWSLNGSRAIVGRGFDGGFRPGDVHARCRCTSHFEPLH